ncbi:hypothetical protein COCON_G00147510 [Conger conger]|uniref:Pleckstrin homology domain-containing family G member 4B n=1 Tax=Conger conger TaxID=82655 RepID=A0A9Q1HUJ2_CONCO|nr:hypothetical protein COCON_G00147510 [Conger conger]
MNPESLDSSVQGVLAALYPPFEVTAPTVLSQLFRVIEERYRGDALQCLLDFLIPAKHILESVRQAACAPYSDVLFQCEGWPLCLRERVVLQLAPVNPLLLSPGDFYLQVAPFGDQAARIVLGSLLEGRRGLEETPVPETSYPCIFTQDWLREVNLGRGGIPLHRCLLCTEQGVLKVPWAQVARPEFVHRPPPPQATPRNATAFALETRILPARDGIAVSLRLVDKPVGRVSPNTWDSRRNRDLEGDYVDLVEFGKEKEALALKRVESLPKNPAPLRPVRPAPPAPPREFPTSCGHSVGRREDPCAPCVRHPMARAPLSQEPRCQYRQSYLQALQSPVAPGQASPPPPPCCRPGDCVVARDTEEGYAWLQRTRVEALSPCPSMVSEPGRQAVTMQKPNGWSHSDVRPELLRAVQLLQGRKTPVLGLVSPHTDRFRKPALVQESHAEARAPSPLTDGQQKKLPSPPGAPPSPRSWGPLPSPPQEFGSDLLHLGVACLPGSRDRAGRAVVEVYGGHQGWKSPLLSSQELCRLLLYLHSVPRKEVGELGVTVVADARRNPPPPAFFRALWMVQELALHAVHCVLMLVDKETHPRPERQPGLQMDVVTSLKALHKTVDGHQLTSALGGTYAYSHSDWLRLYQKMDPFVSHLREASGLLQKAIGKFEGVSKIDTVQDVQQRIDEQKALMREVLEDARLVALQREGGAMLARLRKEEFRFSHSEDYRDSMALAGGLYDQVEEQVHTLVMKSNQSLQHLEVLLTLRELEGRFTQIREWFNAEGERRLLEAGSVEDSLERVERTLESFNSFLTEANERKQQALALVREVEQAQGSSYPEAQLFRTMVLSFLSHLAHFLSQAEVCRQELETMVTLCRFCEGATELAADCRRYLEQSQPGSEVRDTLQGYRERLGQFSAERFQEAKVRACGLQGSRGTRVWNVAWLRRQEAWQLLEDRLGATPPWPCGPGGFGGVPGEAPAQDRDYGTVACCSINLQPNGRNSEAEEGTEASGNGHRSLGEEEEERRSAGGLEDMTTPEPGGQADLKQNQRFPCQQPHSRSRSEGSSVVSVRSEPPAPPSAQRFQISRHGSFCSDDLGCVVPGDDPEGAGPRVQGCPATASLVAEEEGGGNNPKLQRIMAELLGTEREYVRSLGYVMAHYHPLLEQPDVPQALRGQRGRIFGNLEQLYDFHRLAFLRELEACQATPLRVGRCFLTHKESFNLYALYSKNKPQSDSLLLHHGNDFFKQKQQALADRMDLWSYLLKPVQRISKYSLLLQDLLRQCSGVQRGRQKAELQAALQAVTFQLRHGNDLLTMDDIRSCDVNLKEQGQLIRQDEFMVSFRKKKCFRHVFLFQDLILFSKTKKTEVGNNVYIYKQSFKTSDVGMTHSSGDSGRSFEIWFRRRKSQDTYILQAERTEVKDAWTRDLESILWDQAVRSRDIRRQERVFMGLGSRPFMDIQPSEAAICDRAVSCALTGRECKAPVSSDVIAPPVGHAIPRPDSIGSGSSSSTSGSQSSSSSGRGSLSPIGFLCSQPPGGGGASSGSPEEDHLDRDSEKNHHLLDGSASSGESVGGFSGSYRSCLSVIGGDADDTSSITSTLRPKTGHAHQAPSPGPAPKPQTHSAPQSPGEVQAATTSGTSTEV